MPLPGAALAGLLQGSRWPPQDRVTCARSRFPGAEFAFFSLFPLLSLPLSSPLTVHTIPHQLRLGLQLKIENHEGRVTPGREQRRTGSHLALDGGGTDPGSPQAVAGRRRSRVTPDGADPGCPQAVGGTGQGRTRRWTAAAQIQGAPQAVSGPPLYRVAPVLGRRPTGDRVAHGIWRVAAVQGHPCRKTTCTQPTRPPVAATLPWGTLWDCMNDP